MRKRETIEQIPFYGEIRYTGAVFCVTWWDGWKTHRTRYYPTAMQAARAAWIAQGRPNTEGGR